MADNFAKADGAFHKRNFRDGEFCATGPSRLTMPAAPCTMPDMACNCPLPPSPRFTSPPSQSSASGGFADCGDFGSSRLQARLVAIVMMAIVAAAFAHARETLPQVTDAEPGIID